MKKLAIVLIKLYQLTISPFLKSIIGTPRMCRFNPTCSQYTIESIRDYGLYRGTWMGLRRFINCHPFGKID